MSSKEYSQREYSRPAVGANGCAYARLDNYNQNYFGVNSSAPALSQVRSNEIVVVPSYGGFGYQTLTLNRSPSCSGYYNVSNAYPSYPNMCGQITNSLL